MHTLQEFSQLQIQAVESLAGQFRKMLRVNPYYNLSEGIDKNKKVRDVHPYLQHVSKREILKEIEQPGWFRGLMS